MLVTKHNVGEVVEGFISRGKTYALDTETTGLDVHKGDRMFSLIISDATHSCYFNFLSYPYLDDDLCLSLDNVRPLLEKLFSQPDTLWYMQNAKFDMSMLKADGFQVAGDIHDTVVGGRIVQSNHMTYSLDAMAKRDLGEEKDDAVDAYIKKHKLYDITHRNGKREKKPLYSKVPFDIISQYGMTDGTLTFKLGELQRKNILELNSKISERVGRNVSTVMENEKFLTKTLFDMEWLGIKIDRDYCQKAFDYEYQKYDAAQKVFEDLTGTDLVDSGKALAVAFTQAGRKYPRTDKGNPCFNSEVLKSYTDCPLAKSVLDFRAAQKRMTTYYANFLHLADDDDQIHCSLRQSGASTGRMSAAYPNLQNVPKTDHQATFPIRNAFIPREGYCFVMIDFDQMEYRLMLDYANEIKVIRKILDEGLDVHTATAQTMGTERDPAKTLNFLLLYGGGIRKLAAALNVSEAKAKALREQYFDELPRVERWNRQVINRAKQRGWVHNWTGRICYLDKKFEYKAPNALIQGGCADIVKIAMNQLREYLHRLRSRMLLQIHDEILFEVHKDELDIVPKLKSIMETTYPHHHLPLTCGVDHSWKSWGEKTAGLPQ